MCIGEHKLLDEHYPLPLIDIDELSYLYIRNWMKQQKQQSSAFVKRCFERDEGFPVDNHLG